MYVQKSERYRNWVAEEWAGEYDRPVETTPHWNKFEWVGDQGHGVHPVARPAAEMPEGEPGISGFRHNVPASHWVPSR